MLGHGRTVTPLRTDLIAGVQSGSANSFTPGPQASSRSKLSHPQKVSGRDCARVFRAGHMYAGPTTGTDAGYINPETHRVQVNASETDMRPHTHREALWQGPSFESGHHQAIGHHSTRRARSPLKLPGLPLRRPAKDISPMHTFRSDTAQFTTPRLIQLSPRLVLPRDTDAVSSPVALREHVTAATAEARLWTAAKHGDMETIRYILKTDAVSVNDINCADRGSSPLFVAASRGRADVVQLLLQDTGALATIPNDSGLLPLIIAADRGHIEVVKVLLANAEVDINQGILDMASAHGKGLAPRRQSNTPLTTARTPYASPRMPALGGALLTSRSAGHRSGGPVTHRTSSRTARTPGAHSAEQAQISSQSLVGQTALFRAALQGREEVVQLLLRDPRIDVNVSSSVSGMTALLAACTVAQSATAMQLIRHANVDVNKKEPKEGVCPLYAAARKGSTAILQALLARSDCDVNQRTNSGLTALHAAMNHAHLPAVGLLLNDTRTDRALRDQYGRTVFSLACEQHRLECIDPVLQASAGHADDSRLNVGDSLGVLPFATTCRLASVAPTSKAILDQLLAADEVVTEVATEYECDEPVEVSTDTAGEDSAASPSASTATPSGSDPLSRWADSIEGAVLAAKQRESNCQGGEDGNAAAVTGMAVMERLAKHSLRPSFALPTQLWLMASAHPSTLRYLQSHPRGADRLGNVPDTVPMTDRDIVWMVLQGALSPPDDGAACPASQTVSPNTPPSARAVRIAQALRRLQEVGFPLSSLGLSAWSAADFLCANPDVRSSREVASILGHADGIPSALRCVSVSVVLGRSDLLRSFSMTPGVNFSVVQRPEYVNPLWLAAALGDHVAVTQLLKDPRIPAAAPVTSADGLTSLSPLCIAALLGHGAVVLSLVKHPRCRARLGETYSLHLPSLHTFRARSSRRWTPAVARTAADISHVTLSVGPGQCAVLSNDMEAIMSLLPAPPTLLTRCPATSVVPGTAGRSEVRRSGVSAWFLALLTARLDMACCIAEAVPINELLNSVAVNGMNSLAAAVYSQDRQVVDFVCALLRQTSSQPTQAIKAALGTAAVCLVPQPSPEAENGAGTGGAAKAGKSKAGAAKPKGKSKGKASGKGRGDVVEVDTRIHAWRAFLWRNDGISLPDTVRQACEGTGITLLALALVVLQDWGLAHRLAALSKPLQFIASAADAEEVPTADETTDLSKPSTSAPSRPGHRGRKLVAPAAAAVTGSGASYRTAEAPVRWSNLGEDEWKLVTSTMREREEGGSAFGMELDRLDSLQEYQRSVKPMVATLVRGGRWLARTRFSQLGYWRPLQEADELATAEVQRGHTASSSSDSGSPVATPDRRSSRITISQSPPGRALAAKAACQLRSAGRLLRALRDARIVTRSLLAPVKQYGAGPNFRDPVQKVKFEKQIQEAKTRAGKLEQERQKAIATAQKAGKSSRSKGVAEVPQAAVPATVPIDFYAQEVTKLQANDPGQFAVWESVWVLCWALPRDIQREVLQFL